MTSHIAPHTALRPPGSVVLPPDVWWPLRHPVALGQSTPFHVWLLLYTPLDL